MLMQVAEFSSCLWANLSILFCAKTMYQRSAQLYKTTHTLQLRSSTLLGLLKGSQATKWDELTWFMAIFPTNVSQGWGSCWLSTSGRTSSAKSLINVNTYSYTLKHDLSSLVVGNSAIKLLECLYRCLDCNPLLCSKPLKSSSDK